MNWSARKTVQRRFLVAVGHAIYVTWPVLSTILAIQVALGLLISFVEGWSSATRSISPSSPASRLVMAMSCRGRRLGAHLRSGLVSVGSSSRVS
jgi:hypothetical protein